MLEALADFESVGPSKQGQEVRRTFLQHCWAQGHALARLGLIPSQGPRHSKHLHPLDSFGWRAHGARPLVKMLDLYLDNQSRGLGHPCDQDQELGRTNHHSLDHIRGHSRHTHLWLLGVMAESGFVGLDPTDPSLPTVEVDHAKLPFCPLAFDPCPGRRSHHIPSHDPQGMAAAPSAPQLRMDPQAEDLGRPFGPCHLHGP
mmetsp:Transcript_69235/g.152818  ORF Transcript_69235/g.152818 Transcript_69235/m.152818 type:complete len:201 (+) Transcript_69235:997-1599(+)